LVLYPIRAGVMLVSPCHPVKRKMNQTEFFYQIMSSPPKNLW
jgi:hypothetical protein